MLLEMQDREREFLELENSGSQWEDLYDNLPEELLDLSGKPIRKRHNSLAYVQQKINAISAAPPLKKNSKPLVPSKLNVIEKDTLMLTLLLVHGVDHLLNGIFSKVVKINDGKTPNKRMSEEHDTDFTDVGHMMERELYGFVIQHGFDDALPSPFAIHEILGSKHMISLYDKYILDITDALKQLLNFPNNSIEINEALLKMTATSLTPFTQQSNPCVIARESMNASDTAEAPSTPAKDEENQHDNDPMFRGIR